MQAKLQHLQRKDEKRQELSRLTTVDFVMFTSSRNDVGDSWRITGFAVQRARTSVSERFDAVDTSTQRRPVWRVVMASLAVHRRRCSDRIRRNEHQRPASTWSER